MGMMWQFIILSLICGIASSVQIGVNATLAKNINNDIWSAIFALFIGAVGLVIYAVLTQNVTVKWQSLPGLPLWMWTGGLLGAVFVAGSVIAAPKVGCTMFIGLILLGQMLASLLLDHYACLGFQESQINLTKILGMCLLIGGVVLIKRA
jgi:transporter family-2 protein